VNWAVCLIQLMFQSGQNLRRLMGLFSEDLSLYLYHRNSRMPKTI